MKRFLFFLIAISISVSDCLSQCQNIKKQEEDSKLYLTGEYFEIGTLEYQTKKKNQGDIFVYGKFTATVSKYFPDMSDSDYWMYITIFTNDPKLVDSLKPQTSLTFYGDNNEDYTFNVLPEEKQQSITGSGDLCYIGFYSLESNLIEFLNRTNRISLDLNIEYGKSKEYFIQKGPHESIKQALDCFTKEAEKVL